MTSVEDSPIADAPSGVGQAGAPAATAEAPDPSPAPPSSWIGIWALVLSLLGLVGLLPIVGSVLGIVLGRLAIRRSTDRPVRGGRGIGVAAFVIGLVTLAVIAFACAAYSLIVAFGPA